MGRKLLGPGRQLLSAATLSVATLMGAATSGCDTFLYLGVCACTTEFRYYTTTVVDADGSPVTGAEITVTRLRDGHVFSVSQELSGPDGVYTILDDGHRAAIKKIGDVVRVVISVGGTSASGDYFFTQDDCGCHLELIYGPDTLELGAKRSL